MTIIRVSRIHILTISLLCWICVAPIQANSLGGQVPQIPAFLPNSTEVPRSASLPIDGEWTISTIGKRIRIEGGRAFAIDPWVHLFILKIQPSMIVLKDMQRTGPGQYTAYDLPLMGTFNATLQAEGSLDVTVQGAAMPVSYKLIPVRVDDQQTFDLERTGQLPSPINDQPGYGQPPGYTPPPNYGQPPGYNPPPNYGPPPGYTPPPNYGQPPGYTPPPNYGLPPGYTPPPNHGQPPGYSPPPNYGQPPQYTPPPPQHGSENLSGEPVPGEPQVNPDAGQPRVSPW